MKGDLLLCTSNNSSVNKIFGWFIRLFTKGNYAHVAMMIDDYNTIIEAVSPKVQQTLNYWEKYHIYRVDCSEYQIDMAINYARKQIGEWYDWRAVIYLAWLYITFQRSKINDWNNENRWFCSELICTSFREAGIVLVPQKADANVTPQDISESKLVTKIN